MKHAAYDRDFDVWVRVQLDDRGTAYIIEDTSTKITYDDYITVEDTTCLKDLPAPVTKGQEDALEQLVEEAQEMGFYDLEHDKEHR